MVSRKDWWVVGAMLLASSASGCSEPVVPEPWADQPVVVSTADVGSFTLRIEDTVALSGRETTEVSDKGNFKRTLPKAVREKLEAAGFKVVQPGSPADVVGTLQVSDAVWTGKWWETRGNVLIVLANGTDQSPIGQASVHFGGVDFNKVPETTAPRVVDAVLRSAELATFVKTKREKEAAAAAPPPPPTPAPPPPPPPGLERDQLKPVMTTLRIKFRHCYHTGLAGNPGLTGSVVLKLAIAPSGAVEGVEADSSSTLADAGVAACIGSAVKTASFPAAPGPTNLSWPLEFSPDPAPELGKNGGLEAAAIQKAIHGASEKTHACFEAALKKDAALSGSLKLKFTINKKGAVVNKPTIDKASTLKDADLEKCVVEAVKGVSFPEGKKQTEVLAYPIEIRGPG